MDLDEVKHRVYIMNDEEYFYKEMYDARNSGRIKDFLKVLDHEEILEKHRIIPEWPETIPPLYLDNYFFDMADKESIVVQRHNRYSPDLVHSHTFFELIYVYDGSAVNTISRQEINMRTGDFCVIPPGVEHSLGVFDDSVVFNILLRRSTLHSMLAPFLTTTNLLSSFFLNNIYAQRANDYILFHTGIDNAIKQSFLWMYSEFINKQQYYYQAITNTLLLDFYLFVREYSNSVQMPLFNSKMDVQRYALIQYIQDNYRDITLSDLSNKFHYTNEYTSRLIKELTGMTYTEILRTIRIERSESFLETTTMTVANIAEAVGYDTPEHYIRQFKKHTGMTPSAYRKQSPKNILE